MRILVLLIMSISLITACTPSSNQNLEKKKEVNVYEEFDQLSPKFYNERDSIYIVNFWATSCPPCIKEMPHFKTLEEKYAKQKLKVHLVSLDLARDLDKRVLPFIEKHKLTSEVSLLADQNYSDWTEKVDTSWYGALPATLIVNKEKRSFSFGAFENYEDLEEELKLVL